MEPNACPTCGSERVARLAFGYPTPEAREAAARGELVLAGCFRYEDERDPTHACRACGTKFGAVSPVFPDLLWAEGD